MLSLQHLQFELSFPSLCYNPFILYICILYTLTFSCVNLCLWHAAVTIPQTTRRNLSWNRSVLETYTHRKPFNRTRGILLEHPLPKAYLHREVRDTVTETGNKGRKNSFQKTQGSFWTDGTVFYLPWNHLLSKCTYMYLKETRMH